MDIRDLLERISALHGRSYRFKGRYAAGKNHGAYAVEDASGTPLVLKWMIRPDSVALARLERTREVTERTRTTGVPVPRYTLIETLPEGVTYWLQTTLPGQPPARLSVKQIHQLLTWNERQADRALSPEQNWSWYVRAVVFAGKSGWKDSLRDYSSETRTVLSTLEATRLRAEALREAVKHLELSLRSQSLGQVSLSLGVAVYPANGQTAESLIQAADEALYRAKREGRDRVVVAQEKQVLDG